MTEIALPRSSTPRSAIRRIFLSATFVDLQTHRAAVHDIIERMGQFTIGMEQFGAQDGDAQSVSLDQLATADLYVGIVAWRYGYIPSGQVYSVTQQEYQEATRLGLPRYLFLADASTQADESLTAHFPATVRDRDHLPQLLAFREQIKRERVVDFFTTPDDLAKKVGAALHDHLLAHPVSTQQAPHDLPPRAPGYVGHEQDVQTVCAALAQDQPIAIVGMGGIGKSSLAAEAMHAVLQLPQAYPAGVTWVRCDDRIGPDGLAWIDDQLLTAWGAPLAAEALRGAATAEDGLAIRERSLRERLSAKQPAEPAPALVLLDNVERDLPLNRLLDTLSPLHVQMLLTMRSEPATQRVRIVPLDVLASHAAVRLFAERFQGRGGQWDAERDTDVTAQIVAALGYLPLAIELAAARAARTRLSLRELADEMRAADVLTRLSEPLDTNASVRYSLEKTLKILPMDQQTQFACLGLPAGPDWPVSVIERLFSLSETTPVARDLEALAAYSLVSFVADEQRIRRVRLHPLVHEMAHAEWNPLPGEQQHAAVERLLDGVAAWTTQHRHDTAILSYDQDLISDTLQRSFQQRINGELAIQVIKSIRDYVGGFEFEKQSTVGHLYLAFTRQIGDQHEELEALRVLWRMNYYSNHPVEAEQYRSESLTLARAIGDQETVISILAARAIESAEQGSRETAESVYADLQAILRSFEQAPTTPTAYGNLGNLALTLGKFDEAEALYRQARTSAESTGALGDLGIIMHNQGDLERKRGNVALARQYYEECLAMDEHLNNSGGIAVPCDNLGELAMQEGDLDTAHAYFERAKDLWETQNIPPMALHVRGNLVVLEGERARLSGNDQEARRLYREAIALLEQSPDPYGCEMEPRIAYVRERIALLPPEPTAVPAVASAAKRRWWPWG
jgi:tetratricopeptide (TPR) repeat protein